MSKKSVVLVEDQKAYRELCAKAWAAYRDQFQVIEKFDNEQQAFAFVKKHASKVDCIMTDLRIKSGPHQDFMPPVNTRFVYGIRLLEDLSREGITHIPVVAYSQYMSPGSETEKAVRTAKSRYPFLVAVLPSSPDEHDMVKRCITVLYKYWEDECAAG